MIATNYKPEQCTYLGDVGDYRVFENPEYGDEAPVLVEIDGQLIESDTWDASDADELIEQVEHFLSNNSAES